MFGLVLWRPYSSGSVGALAAALAMCAALIQLAVTSTVSLAVTVWCMSVFIN